MQIRFHSNIFPQPSVCLYALSPLSSYFLALALLFFLLFLFLLSCTRQTHVYTVPLLGRPLYPSMFSRLRYHILFQLALPFVIFSHTVLSTMAGNLMAYRYYSLYADISTFSRLYLFQVGTFLVLLLIRHYSSYLSILVSFKLLSSALFPVVFTNSAFPSHTSPAYSNFGAITIIRTHLLILLWCQGADLLGSHPSCLLVSYPLLLRSLCAHPKSSPLRSLRTGEGGRGAGQLSFKRGFAKRRQRGDVRRHVYTNSMSKPTRI